MKYLDGSLGDDETASFHQMMMECPEARAWLREAAGHAVAIVDAHRCAALEQVDLAQMTVQSKPLDWVTPLVPYRSSAIL